MAELQPFKDLYSPAVIDAFGNAMVEVYPEFNKKKFTANVFDKNWKEKELKQRMRHIAETLHDHLPGAFENNTSLLVKSIDILRRNGVKENTIEYMFFPDYVEVYGLEHFTTSVKAIEEITQFTSCEYAVRPFILKYGGKMLQQMIKWGNHKNYKVRRLASEGSRPRLPWAMALPELKKDPSPILPMLEKLKDDEHEWVRRSVANHLNDISKDNPQIVLDLFKKWHGKSKEADWVIKHGSRTLLKQGHTELLELFGFEKDTHAVLTDFRIVTPEVKMGGDLLFSFSVRNTGTKPKKIRLEYAMYYMKANGMLSKKIFKISEREYAKDEAYDVLRKQSFRPITTRVYHCGLHKVAVVINGVEVAEGEFYLK